MVRGQSHSRCIQGDVFGIRITGIQVINRRLNLELQGHRGISTRAAKGVGGRNGEIVSGSRYTRWRPGNGTRGSAERKTGGGIEVGGGEISADRIGHIGGRACNTGGVDRGGIGYDGKTDGVHGGILRVSKAGRCDRDRESRTFPVGGGAIILNGIPLGSTGGGRGSPRDAASRIARSVGRRTGVIGQTRDADGDFGSPFPTGGKQGATGGERIGCWGESRANSRACWTDIICIGGVGIGYCCEGGENTV